MTNLAPEELRKRIAKTLGGVRHTHMCGCDHGQQDPSCATTAVIVDLVMALVAEARREQIERDAQLAETVAEEVWEAAAYDIPRGVTRGVFIEHGQKTSARISAQEDSL